MLDLFISLPNRTTLKLTGKDRHHFLQGIITNDIEKLSAEHAIYTALLTPQGKYLFDFFLIQQDDHIFIDCAAAQKDALIKRLTMYKLRSEVAIEDVSDSYEVVAAIGDDVADHFDYPANKGKVLEFCKGIAFIDPRHTGMFARVIIERSNEYQSFYAKGLQPGKFEVYEHLRIDHQIPDSDTDLISDKSFPLDYGLDNLGAIDFEKGCYVGQEVTTRTKHRGVIRKKLYKVSCDTDLPDAGTEITQDGKKIGTLGSSVGGKGLALLRSDQLAPAKELTAADHPLQIAD